MDLNALDRFAEAVGTSEPVTIAGLSTRGGALDGVRAVEAPSGVWAYSPEEMTVSCGAATPNDELAEALAAAGQIVVMPPGGSVGGALVSASETILRLGRGPMRDSLLEARVVSADGALAKVGGPTVKNVSGFDLCRLLVGSYGTLAFVGGVTLRTRPRPPMTAWFMTDRDPAGVRRRLYRPSAVLWNGVSSWVCLEGHGADVAAEAAAADLVETDGPPLLPPRHWSVDPTVVRSLGLVAGTFVAELGIGTIHADEVPPQPSIPAAIVELNARVKAVFDPTGRLNPGRKVAA